MTIVKRAYRALLAHLGVGGLFRTGGIVLNFVGAILIFWHARRVVWIDEATQGVVTTFGLFPWWKIGLGLIIIGFLCQVIGHLWGIGQAWRSMASSPAPANPSDAGP